MSSSTATAVVSGLNDVASLEVSSQSKNVTFSGSTATALTLGLTGVAATADTTVDLDDAAATSLTLNLSGNGTGLTKNVLTLDQNAATATAVTVNVTGANYVDGVLALDAAKTLNVAGTGSLTVDGANTLLTALQTLNVTGGASVDLSDIGTLGALKTVAAGSTTGDVSIIVDDTATALATGSGDDVVEYTAAIAASATVSLGAGDDELTVTDADKTAVISGGEGTDTLAGLVADIAALTADADKSAAFAGFEVLKVTDALGTGDNVDVSAIDGVTSFVAGAGVTTAETATVSGIGANATVTLEGAIANNGDLTVTLADATGSADVLNLVLNKAAPADNADTTVDYAAVTIGVAAAGVETVNLTANAAGAADGDIDLNNYTVTLTDTALTTLNISGAHKVTFAADATMDKLVTIDASATTGGVDIDVDLVDTKAVTITGGSGDDTIKGSDFADTINGGAGNDTITGGAKADALNGGEGNDVFVMAATTDSTLINLDVITGFVANTFGQGTDGAATDAGADIADIDDWTGDVIDLSAIAGSLAKIDVSVQSNAADAQTFLQNLGQATADTIGVALDSSSGRLYIDVTSDGTVDSVIQLTGVTTIDEAAFII